MNGIYLYLKLYNHVDTDNETFILDKLYDNKFEYQSKYFYFKNSNDLVKEMIFIQKELKEYKDFIEDIFIFKHPKQSNAKELFD